MQHETSTGSGQQQGPSYACSICGKQQEQVRQLLIGPPPSHIAICDECVQTHVSILSAEGVALNPPSYLFPYRLVARLWADMAELATTVMAIEGWMSPEGTGAQFSGSTSARAELPARLHSIIRSARRLAQYYTVQPQLEEIEKQPE